MPHRLTAVKVGGGPREEDRGDGVAGGLRRRQLDPLHHLAHLKEDFLLFPSGAWLLGVLQGGSLPRGDAAAGAGDPRQESRVVL